MARFVMMYVMGHLGCCWARSYMLHESWFEWSFSHPYVRCLTCITWYVIYWSYYPFFQDLILRPYQKLFYSVRGLEICWYIIEFEYSSELFCHSSDIGHGYREFPVRGIQVLLDVWPSMGVSSMSVSIGWVLLINQSRYPFLVRASFTCVFSLSLSPTSLTILSILCIKWTSNAT